MQTYQIIYAMQAVKRKAAGTERDTSIHMHTETTGLHSSIFRTHSSAAYSTPRQHKGTKRQFGKMFSHAGKYKLPQSCRSKILFLQTALHTMKAQTSIPAREPSLQKPKTAAWSIR